MDIGSAKIKPEQMQGIPHHLVDVLEPEEEFNVVRFQQMAKEACAGIWERGRIPIIAGGTGFYIQALLYDIDFGGGEGAGPYRARLEAMASEGQGPLLHRMLAQVDPEAAAAIHENNVKRVIRALEYYEETGMKISAHNEEQRKRESPYSFLYAVLTRDRAVLYERIDRRVDQMMEEGLLAEVKSLRDMGLKRQMVSMQGLGYKELFDYLDGGMSLEEAVRVIKRDTRHFAKRQMTWFRREKDVTFYPMDGRGEDEVLGDILADTQRRGILPPHSLHTDHNEKERTENDTGWNRSFLDR